MPTEKEARIKVCPHLPVDYEADHLNQVTKVQRFALCVASHCMMWRELDGRERYFVTFEDKAEEEWQWNPTNNRDYGDRVKVRIVPPETFGYCGLAGKPGA